MKKQLRRPLGTEVIARVMFGLGLEVVVELYLIESGRRDTIIALVPNSLSIEFTRLSTVIEAQHKSDFNRQVRFTTACSVLGLKEIALEMIPQADIYLYSEDLSVDELVKPFNPEPSVVKRYFWGYGFVIQE